MEMAVERRREKTVSLLMELQNNQGNSHPRTYNKLFNACFFTPPLINNRNRTTALAKIPQFTLHMPRFLLAGASFLSSCSCSTYCIIPFLDHRAGIQGQAAANQSKIPMWHPQGGNGTIAPEAEQQDDLALDKSSVYDR